VYLVSGVVRVSVCKDAVSYMLGVSLAVSVFEAAISGNTHLPYRVALSPLFSEVTYKECWYNATRFNDLVI
jgi:hypothetical protein